VLDVQPEVENQFLRRPHDAIEVGVVLLRSLMSTLIGRPAVPRSGRGSAYLQFRPSFSLPKRVEIRMVVLLTLVVHLSRATRILRLSCPSAILQLQRPRPGLGLSVVLDIKADGARKGEGNRLGHIEKAANVQEGWPLAVRRRRVPQVEPRHVRFKEPAP